MKTFSEERCEAFINSLVWADGEAKRGEVQISGRIYFRVGDSFVVERMGGEKVTCTVAGKPRVEEIVRMYYPITVGGEPPTPTLLQRFLGLFKK